MISRVLLKWYATAELFITFFDTDETRRVIRHVLPLDPIVSQRVSLDFTDLVEIYYNNLWQCL